MANETILIVDADTKSQKVLEVSFKKAGYRVVMTDGPRRAQELVQDTSPDIIVCDTAFPNGGDGFEFLADLKSGSGKSIPFIFLTEERSLPQKMKGFELGADDYLTKPIYIKEVTTRVELLLQKRAKESLTDDHVEELEGNLADITMIDLLQTIEEELRSGTIHLTRDMQSAVIYFREGNILDAICGKLQGEESIYRLMLWPDGEFVLRYHDQVRRVDRIEKDSGALLLEGIRRLDKYNELLDELPNLGNVYEADFRRLTQIASGLPDEVGRVVRLFDGLRSIREVCEGSPLDDVTTLKIVRRLIEDDLIADVTPEKGRRAEMNTRSNLAAWLEGARSESLSDSSHQREDTSPKFGSSITEMVEKRITERHERPAHRQTLDNPFASLPFDDEEEEESDPRRQTHMQWDIRPKSDWNIHLDDPAAGASTAAILEIEAEERRRRELEARQLQGGTALPAPSKRNDVHRESTLRFAPAVERQAPMLDDPLLRDIEEDERRRRNEEAKRLQEQLQSLQSNHGPLSPALRRKTDELPIQPRMPAVPETRKTDPDPIFGTGPIDSDDSLPPRERVNTPLSAPAFISTLEERSSDPRMAHRGFARVDDSGETPGLEVLSEADAFEDDSDELPRSERSTLDLRPPAELAEHDVSQDLDPAGLFDNLASDDTSPVDDSYDELEIMALGSLPAIERHATDNQLVRASYDLSRRRAIAPHEIEGRAPTWERETVELPHAQGRQRPSAKLEGAFFEADTPISYDFHDEEEPRSSSLGWVVALVALVAVAAGILLLSNTEKKTAEFAEAPVVQEPLQADPAPVIEEPVVAEPVVPPLGLDTVAASQRAVQVGSTVGAGSEQLAVVMSGEVLPVLAEKALPVEETTPVVAVTQETPVEKEAPPVSAPAEKAVTASPGEVKEAQRLMQREQYDEALALLRKLSKSAPKDEKIAYLHGIAAFNANHTSEAIDSLSRAERLGHRTADLYLELAAAYQLDRKPQKAKWAYEKFLALQPNGRQADEVRTILSTQF